MNEDHPEILTRGRIVVDPRQPREDRLATVLHELFHVVADAGHSQRNESVLNQSDFAGVVRLTALAEVDRALLRFLYGAVAPGDSADDVRWKFTYAWPLRTAAQ
jgi:predicted Zn-dependent protease